MRYQGESFISHGPLWIKDGLRIHRVKLTGPTQSSYFIEYEQIGFHPIPLEFNFVVIMTVKRHYHDEGAPRAQTTVSN